MQVGYFGKQPFKDMPPMIELVTDIETCWELDKLGGSNADVGHRRTVPGVVGQLAVRAVGRCQQILEVRFQRLHRQLRGARGPVPVAVQLRGRRRRAVPLPGRAAVRQRRRPAARAAAAGLKDIVNPDFQSAQYCWSYLWHRKALQVLVSRRDAGQSRNAVCSSRNFGGRWQFVMDNLGADSNGQPIENKRRNKGQFIADFKQAMRPQYTELSELIFHKREPACVIVVAPCNPDPGYPSQNYESDPVDCTGNPIID